MTQFATQSEAWRRGYAWAGNYNDHRDIDTAMDDYGYDFGSRECEDFLTGAEVKQAEQIGDMFGYDDED